MTKWNLSISDSTDRIVRTYLAQQGFKKGDLSKFVEDAVLRTAMMRTIKEIHEMNKDLSADDAMKLANEAVAWARANRT
jgi:hypothetical protein